MSPASTIMKRVRPASSILYRRRPCQGALSASAAIDTSCGRPADDVRHGWATSLASPSGSPWRFGRSMQPVNPRYFSAVAQDWDDGDGGDGGNLGNSGPGQLLPTRHSRNLPPLVCPPSQLRTEVEAIFDAPVGSLIVYKKSDSSTELKSAEEEMADAYYASDEVVQRVEYILRGLNHLISKSEGFVGRSVGYGDMTLDGEDGEGDLTRDECFRAMLDLMERMVMEGQTYEELRTRVRSQLLDPSSLAGGDSSSSESSSSDSDSSDSSDSDGEEERELTEKDADEHMNTWIETMEENMSKAGLREKKKASKEEADEDEAPPNKEEYQFGAFPGITAHMYDLVLDSLACLCQEHFESSDRASSFAEMVELMPDGASPPELAKEILDVVLNRHWQDGGDIGLGNGGLDHALSSIAQGVGAGFGTGAGNLARIDPHATTFDVRTCPTPMTFNAVLRIAANFDPAAYAEAVDTANVLSGDMGKAPASISDSDEALRMEQERLRDVTLDAALSTYSRMQYCKALTLRTLKNSTKKATSRQALKRQARLLADNYKGKRKNDVISGRNSATYAYMIKTIGNCIPPSMSRGNMAFALYSKGCVEEGVMDEGVVKAMRGVGGYVDAIVDDIELEEGEVPPPMAPPVSNGPLFDNFMQQELGSGVEAALDEGRRRRQDRNYRLRRHIEWDGTY